MHSQWREMGYQGLGWGLGLALSLPVLSLLLSWGWLDANGADVLRQMVGTVLPTYAASSLWLSLWVGIGVAVWGVGTATAVTLLEFPGRRFFEWALLLPLAMPAYVVAYAYTDFLQFSGPLQTWLRSLTGWEGRVFPDIRQLGGAVWVFTFTLYPYVYLLVRASLTERIGTLMEAAGLLGASRWRRLWVVALPLARPAVAAGVALALMEVLADFGVVSYFGLSTFTAGIYKAWLVMDNRWAAAQLSTLLLVLVALLVGLEQRSRQRVRFALARQGGAPSGSARWALSPGQARLVAALCVFPLLAGFVWPVLFMLMPLLGSEEGLPWGAFWGWTGNSLYLASLAALAAVALALLLSAVDRLFPSAWTRMTLRVVGLGYAIPGAVVVVGLLWPLTQWQAWWPESGVVYAMTATVFGLLWAYLVRFTAVALQSVQSGYARLPRSLDDSARMLGCTAGGLWWRVHRPLLKRSIGAASLLVFVDVMKELPATLVLRPFGSDTLAVVTYQLARDERLGEAALPALALVLAGLLPVWLLSRTLRPAEAPHRSPPVQAVAAHPSGAATGTVCVSGGLASGS